MYGIAVFNVPLDTIIIGHFRDDLHNSMLRGCFVAQAQNRQMTQRCTVTSYFAGCQSSLAGCQPQTTLAAIFRT